MKESQENDVIRISDGFRDAERLQVARLYWQAFGGKLGILMRPEEKALMFLEQVLAPEFALAARDRDDHLLGIAGYKTSDGALVGGGLRDLANIYGVLGAVWRGAFLALLDREERPGTLLMDGIFVVESARGRGVGTALLDAIKDRARALDLTSVRLDVIDTNPRARALYERQGFVALGTENIGLLRHLFGFTSSTKMRCHLD